MSVTEIDFTTDRVAGWQADDQPAVYHTTDLGNAERLVAEHGRDLLFVPGPGWHAWDGRRWRRDTDGEVMRRAKLTVRAIAAEAAAVDDDEARKRLLRHALESEREPRLRAAVSLAASDREVIVDAEQLDADPLLLNVANGIIHLRAGELVKHSRSALLSKLVPVTYDPTAKAPRWTDFLRRIFAEDDELIAFVQRAVGYSLTGLTVEQILFLLYGTGANGKTTFVETLRALFGEYGQQTPAETFLERRETIPNDLARLPGVRFVAAVETGEGRRLNETMVKRLVGGDTIAARFMRSEWFEFEPCFKPWVATNHKPVIRGTDEAIWRRIRLVPFTVTIPEGERDPNLRDKLLDELGGILAWAVDGCLAYLHEGGLGKPEAVTRATAGYRGDMDLLGTFLGDCCLLGDTYKAKAGDLYREYGSWCDRSGERDRLSQQSFGRSLTERGFHSHRNGRGRWWTGIGLLTTDGDEP
jgi:putative DNA primase/helicase